MSFRTTAEPTKPVAPVTKMRTILFSLCRPARVAQQTQPRLTSQREFDKPELVSAYIDYRRLSPVASFWRMATKSSKSKARKPRADAQRNRERLLEVAKE